MEEVTFKLDTGFRMGDVISQWCDLFCKVIVRVQYPLSPDAAILLKWIKANVPNYKIITDDTDTVLEEVNKAKILAAEYGEPKELSTSEIMTLLKTGKAIIRV